MRALLSGRPVGRGELLGFGRPACPASARAPARSRPRGTATRYLLLQLPAAALREALGVAGTLRQHLHISRGEVGGTPAPVATETATAAPVTDVTS